MLVYKLLLAIKCAPYIHICLYTPAYTYIYTHTLICLFTYTYPYPYTPLHTCIHTYTDKDIVIVDDLVQSGGTLYECAVALKEQGSKDVHAYVTHAVFPNNSWRDFCHGQNKGIFTKFWLTNSQPTITSQLPVDDVFEVLDLTPQILLDLDGYTGQNG